MLPPTVTASEGRSVIVRRTARRRREGLAVATVLLVASVIGAAVVPVPYVTLRPGSIRPLSALVRVEGAPSYPPEESIALTTVSVGPATLLEALAGWLDDDVDVRPEKVIQGSRSEKENRQYNLQLMDTSKLTAIAVALEHLGHSVTIRTSGAVVRQIVSGSPAAAVLKPNDVIVAVDGAAVDQPDELGMLLQAGGPGTTHALTVERPAGTRDHIELEVATVGAPDDAKRSIIGVAIDDRITDFDFPFDVAIDSGDIGGPSAGLAFTLAVLDQLTPGELTGGHKVVVTGTMSLSGAVGPVGAGAQKAITVREAGYEVFLVPPDELAQVTEAVGDSLRVIAVSSLDEALAALASIGGDVASLEAAVPTR